ncbi:MAG: hypothetical protein OEY41_07270, partial [Acidimicrobiia bacterium]|nr:hypothetical protein [Acidimicrobiia bacterium]
SPRPRAPNATATATSVSGSSSATADTGVDTAAAGGATASAGAEIPDETQGPYPADGSNGPNILGKDGIVRADITSSVADLSGTADGVPLAVQCSATGGPISWPPSPARPPPATRRPCSFGSDRPTPALLPEL